jgi:hypothetical protein
MENMRGGVTSQAMHVISKPALPVPNSFKGMQGRSWAGGLVSLLKKTRKTIVLLRTRGLLALKRCCAKSMQAEHLPRREFLGNFT